jgi:hypothetical protein
VDANKWRIRKDWRFPGMWVVLAPGSHIRAEFVTHSQARCVEVLPVLIFLRNERRKGR